MYVVLAGDRMIANKKLKDDARFIAGGITGRRIVKLDPNGDPIKVQSYGGRGAIFIHGKEVK